jgi:hypothetical protein
VNSERRENVLEENITAERLNFCSHKISDGTTEHVLRETISDGLTLVAARLSCDAWIADARKA